MLLIAVSFCVLTFSITIVDSSGRRVDVTSPVRKVFSDYSLVPPFIYMLGEGDKFIGSYFFGWKFYTLVDNNLNSKLKYGKRVPVETIIALKPDVYITRFSAVDTKERKQIAEMGIPVVGLNFESVENILSSIEILGKIFGKEEKVKEIRDYYVQIYEDVLNKTKLLKNKPKVLIVYYVGKSKVLKTFGGDMFQSVLLDIAGGVSVSKDLKYKVTINAEQILKWNPDYIFVMQYGNAPERVKDLLLSDPVLKEVSAVKKGHVYMVPSDGENWIDPCPKWGLGLYWMAKVLHPELFDVDLKKFAEDFYKRFFGVDINEVQLKGDGL